MPGSLEVVTVTLPDEFPQWHVSLFLGDQCEIALCGHVTSMTEREAIADFRQIISLAWPKLYADAHLDSTPAMAHQIPRCR